MLGYLLVAVMTILFYDFLLTLSREVGLFQHRQWNAVRLLHFVIRLTQILDIGFVAALARTSNPTVNECEIWLNAQTWINLVGYVAVEIIFIIRTYAIWNKNKQIGTFLFTLLVFVGTGGALILKYFYVDSIEFFDFTGLFNSVQGCYGTNPSTNLLWITYLLLLIHESAILLFTLLRSLRNKSYDTSYLFLIIFRDGVSVYVCLFVISIINIILLNARQFRLLSVGFTFLHRTLNAILCIRLLSNIREAVGQEVSKE